MTRHGWLLLLVAGCGEEGPRLTGFSGLTLRRDDRDIELNLRVGDRLLIEYEMAPSPGRDVWVWTLNVPPGWDVDPRTGVGKWEVLPGTPQSVSMPVLVAFGAKGTGPARAYGIYAQVDDNPDTDVEEP